MAKIGIVSLGCAKNLVDSEVMLGLLQKSGHEITPEETQAEIIIVNTCGFIGPAKEESVGSILEMAKLKQTGPCQKLIVTGCLVERYRDEIQQGHINIKIDFTIAAGLDPPDRSSVLGFNC